MSPVCIVFVSRLEVIDVRVIEDLFKRARGNSCQVYGEIKFVPRFGSIQSSSCNSIETLRCLAHYMIYSSAPCRSKLN